MRTSFTTFFCSLAIALSSASSIAEAVHVPIGQQGSNQTYIEKPKKGMTKSQVEKQFGQPKDWRDAVGDPPISSWVYDDYTVYFEYEHVIHSVLKHRPIN